MEITWQILSQIKTNFRLDLIPQIIFNYKMVFLLTAVGFAIHWLPSKTKTWYQEKFINSPVPVKILVAVIAVFGVYQAMSSELQAFIYFQF